MASFVRSILPISSKNRSSSLDDEDGNSMEYSFAMEYSGPPVSYEIPQVVPVNVDQIPIASVVASASAWSLTLPVIQPIVKKNHPKFSKPSGSAVPLGEFDGSSEVGSSPCLVCNDEQAQRVSCGIESSGTLGFSDSRDGSNELSGSSDVEDLQGDANNNGLDVENSTNTRIFESGESGITSQVPSYEVSSSNGEEDMSCDENRTAMVTFREPEASDIESEESSYYDQPEIIRERPSARTDLKKGLCHRCLKGNRLTDKEFCIVCNAKYCSNCVVRAMGSMPEGRKCLTCIGYPIDESKRGALGKCSRMLKRLLTDWEVKNIMNAEVSCEANQLPPELVYVNGKPLSNEELVELRSCQYPPKKLRPGKYWYDKVSGLWGKEGEKPCQIISSQLAVGDSLKIDASNGSTNIQINGRVITKSELRMLQIAGVHCEGNLHFWVGADGSYQEEGMRHILGRIWDKPGIKFVCAVLSLPIPFEIANPNDEEINNPGDKFIKMNPEQKKLNKFLLIGRGQSGTSTIFKQTKIAYHVPFSEDERQNIKVMIQSNLYRYIGILLEGREQFEEELLNDVKKKRVVEPSSPGDNGQIDENSTYSISPRLKSFSDWLLQVMMCGNIDAIFPAATREYAQFVEDLWKDRGFQATYKRRNELHALPTAANYFMDRAIEISKADYEPSDMDILYAEGITSSNGVAAVEFSFPKSSHDSFMEPNDQNDPLLRYQLIRVHANSLGDNCKWLEMFEDVDLVLFCVSLTDYDQFSEDNNGVLTNKMIASKKLFESIVTHPTFVQKDFLLILSKFDLLEQKIEEVPLSQCEWFLDFNPVRSHNLVASSNHFNNNNSSMAQRAFHYIAVRFKRLFHSLSERKLYVSQVIGLEPDSVDGALRYGSEILKWDEQMPLTMNDLSSESVEVSTSTG